MMRSPAAAAWTPSVVTDRRVMMQCRSVSDVAVVWICSCGCVYYQGDKIEYLAARRGVVEALRLLLGSMHRVAGNCQGRSLMHAVAESALLFLRYDIWLAIDQAHTPI